MDISKFIKNKQSDYDNDLEIKIENVEKLVKKSVISPQFGTFLMTFLIRKEVGEIIKHNLEHILRNHNQKDQWLFINYSKRRTTYI